jgi:tetratricopeptide (TPR) repeat protein
MTARLVWLGLCLAVGAGLGLILLRSRFSPSSPGSQLLAAAGGAVAGVTLGALPAPLTGLLRRLRSALLFHLLSWRARRTAAAVERRGLETLRERPDDGEAQLQLACAAWLTRSRERAEQLLAKVLAGPAPSPLARHSLAVLEATAGRRTRAVEVLEGARPHLEQSVELHWTLALARWGLRQYREAAACFARVLQLAPNRLEARHALAVAMALQGEVDEAIAMLENSRRDPGILCSLGIIYQSRADLPRAEQCFAAALQRQPTHIAARFNRAICALLDGRYHAAIDDFVTLNRLAPHFPRAFAQKGICWYRLGQPRKALDAARHAVRTQPADFQVRYNVGTLLVRENQLEPALKELERAHELEPRDVDVIVNLGVAVHLNEMNRQALDHFRLAVRLNPKHALARYNCAVIYTMLDMLSEAEGELDALLELYPDFPEAFNEVGVVYLRQNRLLEAAGQLRSAADAMPRSALCRSNLAITYYQQGDLSAAFEQAVYAAAIDPKLAAARELAGRTAMEMRDYKEAITQFGALAKLEPSNPDAHANLGFAYYKDDRLNDAIECYRRVLVFAPHSPEGHNDLGLAYAKNKMLGEAVRHLVQVMDWRPDSPIVHSNLGLVYYFKGESESAVERWRDVTRLSPVYARKREATRFSAYDDQEMTMRALDLRKRCSHYPLKIAGFRHSFHLALDEHDYRMELPWRELAAVARWQRRARFAREAMARA